MSIIRINLDTTSKLFIQVVSQHTIPGLTHELLLSRLRDDIGGTIIGIDKDIPGQLLLHQALGDVGAVLNASTYPPNTYSSLSIVRWKKTHASVYSYTYNTPNRLLLDKVCDQLLWQDP